MDTLWGTSAPPSHHITIQKKSFFLFKKNRYLANYLFNTHLPSLVWTQTGAELPTVSTILFDNGTRLNDTSYPAKKVYIYQNGAYWKQSELAGKGLDTWKSKLTDGHHLCQSREDNGKLFLTLKPRTNTESWDIGTTSVSIKICDTAPIHVEGNSYTFDQVRLFGKGQPTRTGGYWSIKKILDTPQNENGTHISEVVTHIRHKQPNTDWLNLLILVPTSEQENCKRSKNRILPTLKK